MEKFTKILIIIGIIFGIFLLIFYVLPYLFEVPEIIIIISAMMLVWLFFGSIVLEFYRLISKKQCSKVVDVVILAVLLINVIPVIFEGAPFNPFKKYENTWEYFLHPEKFDGLGKIKYGESIINSGS